MTPATNFLRLTPLRDRPMIQKSDTNNATTLVPTDHKKLYDFSKCEH